MATDGNEDASPVISGVVVNSCRGEITIVVSAGTEPYSYSWENSGGNPVGTDSGFIDGLVPDTYTVTVTDTTGATVIGVYTITDPPPLVGTVDVTDVLCFGDASGYVDVSISNGIRPYTWDLTNLNNGNQRNGFEVSDDFDIGSLVAADYQLVVVDFQGCVGTLTFTVKQPAAAVGASVLSRLDPLCFGESTGAITVEGTGGTVTLQDYRYDWFVSPYRISDIVSDSSTLFNVPAGTYRLRVRDQSGCSYTEDFTLTDPPELVVSDTTIVGASCHGLSDGSVDIEVTGGTGNLSYSWSNSAMSEDLSNLAAGTYTVTITDDNGCSLVETYMVGQPTAINLNENITNISCRGESAGAINVSVSGGQGPYTISWSDGPDTQNRSGLTAGSYTLMVTDDTGCTVSETYTITEPMDGLSIDSFIETLPVCTGGADGTLSVNVSGGVTPYSYQWSNGQTVQSISNLTAGTYEVLITDANGCTLRDDFVLNDPTPIALTVTPASPDCNGDTNGSISVSASNGTGPYTYSWNTGSSDPMISGLASGAYTVTVTDDIGCSVAETIMLTEPDVLMVNGMDMDISCNGFDDGSITTAASGGTAPYTYSWSNEAGTTAVSALEPGMYSVTITDANNCEATENYTITEPAELISSALATDILCKGDNTGAVSLSVSGGTTPYTYQWSDGQSTANLAGIVAGNYMVTVTDANGCETIASALVNEPAALLVIQGQIDQITCNGDADGAVSITVTGGEAPYVYSWSNGSTSEDLDNLIPGIYTITVTDNIGCVKTAVYEITDPPVLSASGAETPVSCNGAVDGSIDLTVSGGEGPYTFVWAHGPTTEDVGGLDRGSYAVIVTDSRGCTTNAAFSITEPEVLTSSSTQTEVNCKGAADGTVQVTVTGGTMPYTYSWSNGSTDKDLNGVVAGDYTLTITDNRGCTTAEMVTLTEPTEGLTVTPKITNVLCSGESTGSIELTVSGGTGPYTYLWNTGATTEDILNVLPGAYQVTVTDSQGCTRLERYDVIAPDALSISESVSALSCFESGDGAINVTISGGTQPYTYLWSNGASTEDLAGLTAGTYTVTVTDSGNCSTSGNFIVDQPTEIIINPLTRGVSCFGETDGLIDISVSGGLAPYTYTWSEGSTTQDLTGLAGGTYTVTVTDNTNCQVTTSVMVEAPDAALSATGAIADIGCNGDQSGGVALTVTGGTAPYRFVWSNGSTLQNLQNVFPGNYQVTITDDNDCTFEAGFDIGESDPIEATFEATEPTCPNDANGSILLEVTGGVAPYTYFWSNGSTSKDQFNLLGGPYTVTIRDANNCTVTRSVDLGGTRGLDILPAVTAVTCKGEATGAVTVDIFGGSGNYTYNWSNGADTRDQSGLTAGLYVLTVTDEDGCDASVTIVISEPSLVLSASVSHTDKLICFGGMEGEARVIPNGGTAPYNYLWSTGDITNAISNLSAGNYSVLVTDANGCTSQAAFVIEEPDGPITVEATGKLKLNCQGDADGSITVDISGGEGPYEVFWNNGRRTNTIENLTEGDYILRVVDTRGCVKEETISIMAPSPIQVASVTINDTQCYGDRTGSIELDIVGGTAPYSYLWSNGSTSQNLLGVGTGDYTVEVTDDLGCTMLASFSLDNAHFFGMVPEIAEISCTDENDASISLNIVGGIAPYFISWNSGQDDETITSLAAGEYTATVTDSNGCIIEQTFVITNPLPLSIEGTVVSADACDNPESGGINLTVTGGRGPYEYSWSHGPDTHYLSEIPPGIYTVTVTDSYGCTDTKAYTVTKPDDINIELTPDLVVDCDTQRAFVRLGARVTGGFGEYQYNWSRGNSLDASLEVNSPGRVTLVVTDGRGCQRQDEIDIDIPQFANASFAWDSESLRRDGGLSANDPISFLDNSGPGARSWSWNFGDEFSSSEQNPTHTFLAAGRYLVTLDVKDEAECITQTEQWLNIADGHRLMIPNAFTPNGDGLNDLFRPRFFGFQRIRFRVFSKWGDPVFNTTLTDGAFWDGILRGESAQSGSYVYKFEGVTFTGFTIEETGVFRLIKK
ncbi:MAG: hypothetical protein Roseis2KO_43700 [Roseivirga sp.]